MRIGTAQVDLTRFTASQGGHTVRLTPQEVALLRVFARAATPLDDGRLQAMVPRDTLYTEGMGYRSADRSRALDYAIRRLRTKLADLSAEPPALQTLRGAGYRLTWTPTPSEKPVGPPTFGRAGWCDRIDDALAAEEVCTLVGPAGVGKSHLARLWARTRPDVCWMRPGQPLGSAPCVVIDQCELDLSAARSLVQRALDAGQQVVCTSRQRLGLLHERPSTVGPLTRSAATELLLHHTRRVGAPAPDPEHLDALCDACDDLPLAVVLVAARLRSLPAVHLLARLHTDAPDPDPLDLAVALAWDALGEPARTTLSCLARLDPVRFAFEDLAACVPEGSDVGATVESLVERGLLSTFTEPGGALRYHLLRPLRRAVRRRAVATAG